MAKNWRTPLLLGPVWWYWLWLEALLGLRARDPGFSPGKFPTEGKENEDVNIELGLPILESKNMRVLGKKSNCKKMRKWGD